MSAGTLTLTNNSDLVSGAGTSFSTELTAGDFIVVTVGGVPYTLPIKAVNSNTSLTLVSIYTGPTQSGAAWFAVPRVALNMVTAALVAQSVEALRGLNYDKQNWQQFFTADGDVTITLPDTSQTTGPSAKKLNNSVVSKASKGENSDITSLSGLTTPLSIAQGGHGGKTTGEARNNLGVYGRSDVYTKSEIASIIDQLSVKYVAWTDETVSALLTIDSTSGAYELMVRVTPTYVHICGIIRKTFDSGNTALFTVKALPPGKTIVRTTHSICFLTGGNIAGTVATIVATQAGGAGTVMRVSSVTTAGAAAIVDMKLFFI